MGNIELPKPFFSNYDSEVLLYKKDANNLVKNLKNVDITYIDPPYNQHPYGSNYFMLNTIIDNKVDSDISKVAGIPKEWNKSLYNKKNKSLLVFEDLIENIDSKFLIISYNNEGFIPLEELSAMLQKYGEVKIKDITYPTFRASRNLQNRSKYVTEYLITLKKK